MFVMSSWFCSLKSRQSVTIQRQNQFESKVTASFSCDHSRLLTETGAGPRPTEAGGSSRPSLAGCHPIQSELKEFADADEISDKRTTSEAEPACNPYDGN